VLSAGLSEERNKPEGIIFCLQLRGKFVIINAFVTHPFQYWATQT